MDELRNETRAMRVRVAANDGSGTQELENLAEELALQAAVEIQAKVARLRRFATRRVVLRMLEVGRAGVKASPCLSWWRLSVSEARHNEAASLLRSDLSRMKTKHEQLASQAQGLDREKGDLAASFEELRREKAVLLVQQKEHQREAQSNQAITMELRESNAALNQKNAALTQKNRDLKASQRELEESLASLQARCEGLKKRKKEANSELPEADGVLEAENEALRGRLASLEVKCAAGTAARVGLEEALEASKQVPPTALNT